MSISEAVLLIGAMVAAGGWFIQWRKAPREVAVLKSQEKENITAAAETAVDVLLKSMEFMRTERAELQPRINALEENQTKNEALIAELTTRKSERDAQIAELQEQNEALKAGIAALTKQIEKDTNETEALRKRIVEVEEKYGRMKRINEKLVKALQDANIPLPDLNGDLPESIKGFKWHK
jgi:chromosome segregation ATPase